MKSIKEKAEDYVDDFYKALGRSQDECPIDVELTKADFEAGANYVLEKIEDVLTNPRRYVNPDKSVEEGMVDALIKYVEQLKSNNK